MACLARLLCIGLFIGFAAPAFALEDTPQNRAQEANRYLQAVPPEDISGEMVRNIAQSLPEQQQQAFSAAMQKNLNVTGINAAAQAALVKVFTADELKALADFYSAPATKAAMAKMGTYMSELMPAIEKEVDAAAGKAEKETGVKLDAKPEQ